MVLGESTLVITLHGSLSPAQLALANQTLEARVDTVLARLSRPAARRAVFQTLYFDGVDDAGHAHGPDAPQTAAAVARVDRALARLLAGLDARG